MAKYRIIMIIKLIKSTNAEQLKFLAMLNDQTINNLNPVRLDTQGRPREDYVSNVWLSDLVYLSTLLFLYKNNKL